MNEYITWKKDAIVLQPVYKMEKWKKMEGYYIRITRQLMHLADQE